MRKIDTGFGIALFALSVVFSIGGDPFSDPLFAVQVLVIGLAGVLFLAGGLTDGVRVGEFRTHWYVFSGVAIALVGLSVSLSLFFNPQFDESVAQAFIRTVAVANALLFVYIGFDTARGSGHANLLHTQRI